MLTELGRPTFDKGRTYLIPSHGEARYIGCTIDYYGPTFVFLTDRSALHVPVRDAAGLGILPVEEPTEVQDAQP